MVRSQPLEKSARLIPTSRNSEAREQKKIPAAAGIFCRNEFLLRWGGLYRSGPAAIEHGTAAAAVAGRDDRQGKRGEHEDDRGPGSELGQQVGSRSRSEGRLAAQSSAEGGREVRTCAALQQNDCDQEEANNNVNDSYQNENHAFPSRRLRTPDISKLLPAWDGLERSTPA